MNRQLHLQELDRRLDRIHASRSQKHKFKAEIKQRFGGTCAYCGCTPRFLTLDLLRQSYSPHPNPSPTRGEGLIPAPLARSGRGAGGEGHIRAGGLLDHVVPQTQGGLNVRSNLAAVCQRCNRSKGSRPLWSWWQASSCWNEDRAIRFAETVLVCKIAAFPEVAES